VIGGLGIRKV